MDRFIHGPTQANLPRPSDIAPVRRNAAWGSVRTYNPGNGGTLVDLVRDETESEPMTVTLYTTVPGVANYPRARAIISWGSGGSFARVEVDFIPGLAIPLFAASIRVDVINDSLMAMTLGAFISKGTQARGKATRTNYLDIVWPPAGLYNAGARPTFSKTFKLHRVPLEPARVTFMTQGATIAIGQVIIGALQECPDLDIPPDTEAILCTNDGANNITAARGSYGIRF